MKHSLFLALFCLFITTSCFGQQRTEQPPDLYAIAFLPTPVLNTPDFSFVFGNKNGNTLHLDDAGLMREVEFIALPETIFTIEKTINQGPITLYQITTVDYPYPTNKGYFIDSRFVQTTDQILPRQLKTLPDQQVIINRLLSAEGSRYIWGGNVKAGIPQLLSFYPPHSPLHPDIRDQWMLKGVDCSGLLYEATHGYTPRNTSALITFGKPVSIANLRSDQIINTVEPLDIIVWEGHVIIVLDKDRAIESRLDYDTQQGGNQGGVKIRTLKYVLDETMNERVPVNTYTDAVDGNKKFVVRRWYNR
jgi:cell wall-associated NlpC family hydrolase